MAGGSPTVDGTQASAGPGGGAADPAARRARVATALVFLTNGALLANVVPRYPQIKSDLGLDNTMYGLAVAAFPVGALLASLASPRLIERWTSARVSAVGTGLLALAFFAVGASPTFVALAAALLVAGACDGIVDVAQNAHGLRVQRRYGRSILNGFHGVWSIGAVLGGLAGSAAAGLDVPVALHLGLSGVLFACLGFTATRFMLPGADGDDRATDDVAPASAGGAPAPARRRIAAPAALTLGLLGIIAACGAVVEDSGNTWGAVFLRDELGAAPAVAGLAFVSLATAMTIGRLTGDRVVDRFGHRRVAAAGGLLVALGMVLVVAVPLVPAALAGYALAGLGTATLVPAAMHTADEVPGLRPGVGLTVVSWILRVGFLLTPPLVGVVADAFGLRYALLVVACAGASVVLAARVLPGRTR